MAAIVAREARPEDIAETAELANRIFRGAGTRPSMGEMFLNLFCAENAPNLAISEAGGRIVSLVGAIHNQVRIGSARLGVASIGSVCSDPDVRGQGHASACLELSIQRAREHGLHLLWVSGGRGLYRRIGCRPAGAFVRLSRTAPAWPAARQVAVQPDSQDADVVSRLSALEGVRFMRTPAQTKTLIACWRNGAKDRANLTRAVALVHRGNDAVAWVAYTLVERDGVRRLDVSEWAGDHLAVAEAVGELARILQAGRVDLLVPAHEHGWHELLQTTLGEPWATQSGSNPGHTFRVLDSERTLAALQTYFEQTGLVPPVLENAQADRDAGSPELTERLFAPGGDGRALVPLPASGINYV